MKAGFNKSGKIKVLLATSAALAALTVLFSAAGCGGEAANDAGTEATTVLTQSTAAKTQTAVPATTTTATEPTAGSSSTTADDSSGGAAASPQGGSQSSDPGAALLGIEQVYIPINGIKSGQGYPMGAWISGNAKSVTLLDQKAPADANGAWTTAFQVQLQKDYTQANGYTLWKAMVNPTFAGKHRVIITVEAMDGSTIDSSSLYGINYFMYQVNP